MSRSLKYDIPGPDWRRSLEELREQGWRGLFQPELAAAEDLVVEIGFGRGEFLWDLAAESPKTAFLGIELSWKRVLKLARRMARAEFNNVRLVQGRAQDVVAEGLPEASVREFWINCPDPWPKKRHAGRRLVQPAFTALLASRLVPGGIVQLATDHPPYAEQMHEVLSRTPSLENVYGARPWVHEVPGRRPTAYELEWRALGRQLHFFAYRRRA
ncbi:MAG: tRNA (guanosine(46)-N7)-methyltransferase TrmB [Proteobacteria bacterium]|nr:tRNA (guanosine(46)-N7)-methyltransferase TrmB [Pseudomonadota bacterium]